MYKHRKIFRKRGTLLRTVRKTTKWIEREEDLTILWMVYTHTILKVSQRRFFTKFLDSSLRFASQKI